MGEHDEICFHYQPSRRQEHAEQLLGQAVPAGGVLHTDGYSAYAWYAKKTGIAHAQCWAHSRRAFVKAEATEPARVAEALVHINVLYRVEEDIRQKSLAGPDKRAWRQLHAKPAALRFFAWVEKQFEAQGLLPSSPFTKALAYVRERRDGLLLYPDDPDVEIDPYDYLVDVLQRVGQHPASRAHELTPRMWKSLFADNPLRSPLHQIAWDRKNVGQLPITCIWRWASRPTANETCMLGLWIGHCAKIPMACGHGFVTLMIARIPRTKQHSNDKRRNKAPR